jgi:recombination protein RecT
MGQEITIVQGVRQTLDKMTPELRAVLPAHIEPAAFIRVAQTAIQNNPELQECTTRSLVASCTKLAEIGLQPDGVDAALVVYNVKVSKRNEPDRWEKQAKPMPMVAGIRDLVRRSGMVKEWKVRLVYSQDHFRHIDGDVEMLEHIPEYLDDDRIVKVYSIAYGLDGSVMSRHVMRIDAVEKIRKRSRSADKGPWVTDYEEMVKKTCLRQHSKALPKAKDDLQRERFMGAIRALDEAEDTLALDRGPVAAALPAPAMSVQDAARRRLAEAVESSALDAEEDRQALGVEQPAAAPAAPKPARKRKTADERLAEANAGREGNGRPAPAAGAKTDAPSQAPASQAQHTSSASSAAVAQSHDEGRDYAYEDEQREDPAPEPEFGRETADQDEPEVEAFRDGWRSRASSKTRVPPRTITSQDVAQAWINGYDAFQKTVDIGNAPRDVDASEAMLSRMIDSQFA